MVLTKQEIRQRIRVQDRWITETRTAIFSSAVPESRFRYIIQMRFNGDQQQNRVVDIEKLEEGATYTMKFSDISVAPAATVPIPENYDIEQPILVLQGGSNLYGTCPGNSIQAMVNYWDDEI